ncbi:MAG: hypothetical protein Kow0079_12270 [Vicingaceae bacterium]
MNLDNDEIKIIKETKTKSIQICLRNDGIYFTKSVYDKPYIHSLKDAIENMAAIAALVGEEKKYYSINYLKNIRLSADARNYYAKHKQFAKASALVTTSTIEKVIGKFFIFVNKPKIPTKLFDNEQKAIEWLYSLKSKESFK